MLVLRREKNTFKQWSIKPFDLPSESRRIGISSYYKEMKLLKIPTIKDGEKLISQLQTVYVPMALESEYDKDGIFVFDADGKAKQRFVVRYSPQ